VGEGAQRRERDELAGAPGSLGQCLAEHGPVRSRR
jgi:hypothetical protein